MRYGGGTHLSESARSGRAGDVVLDMGVCGHESVSGVGAVNLGEVISGDAADEVVEIGCEGGDQGPNSRRVDAANVFNDCDTGEAVGVCKVVDCVMNTDVREREGISLTD